MKGFNFENNLTHQTQAVESTVGIFDNLETIKAKSVDKPFINPQLVFNCFIPIKFNYKFKIGSLT